MNNLPIDLHIKNSDFENCFEINEIEQSSVNKNSINSFRRDQNRTENEELDNGSQNCKESLSSDNSIHNAAEHSQANGIQCKTGIAIFYESLLLDNKKQWEESKPEIQPNLSLPIQTDSSSKYVKIENHEIIDTKEEYTKQDNFDITQDHWNNLKDNDETHFATPDWRKDELYTK